MNGEINKVIGSCATDHKGDNDAMLVETGDGLRVGRGETLERKGE